MELVPCDTIFPRRNGTLRRSLGVGLHPLSPGNFFWSRFREPLLEAGIVDNHIVDLDRIGHDAARMDCDAGLLRSGWSRGGIDPGIRAPRPRFDSRYGGGDHQAVEP